MANKTTNGLRQLIIKGMAREKLIDFIKRKDSFYSGANFSEHSDEHVRQIALSLDKKVQIDRQKKNNRG